MEVKQIAKEVPILVYGKRNYGFEKAYIMRSQKTK